jgi:hypothetical protein
MLVEKILINTQMRRLMIDDVQRNGRKRAGKK